MNLTLIQQAGLAGLAIRLLNKKKEAGTVETVNAVEVEETAQEQAEVLARLDRMEEKVDESINAVSAYVTEIGNKIDDVIRDVAELADDVTSIGRQALEVAKATKIQAAQINVLGQSTGKVEELDTAAVAEATRHEEELKEKAQLRATEEAEAKKIADARELADKAVKEAKELAEKEAKELAEKEAKELAEKEAKELAEKEAKELAEKEAKELADRAEQERLGYDPHLYEVISKRVDPNVPSNKLTPAQAKVWAGILSEGKASKDEPITLYDMEIRGKGLTSRDIVVKIVEHGGVLVDQIEAIGKYANKDVSKATNPGNQLKLVNETIGKLAAILPVLLLNSNTLSKLGELCRFGDTSATIKTTKRA